MDQRQGEFMFANTSFVKLSIKNYRVIEFFIYVLFIIYVMIIAFGSIDGFPEEMQTNNKVPYLSDKPIGEDAYYMLTVSKNLASGEGLVYNFKKETTGVQPLAVFIYSAIYKISSNLFSSQWTILRLIILFNASLLILFSITLIKVVRTINKKAKLIALVIPTLTLFNFGLFRIFTYGLETGTYLLFFSITLYYTLKFDFRSLKINQVLILSLLIGITVLARVDFIVVIIIFFLIQLATKTISIKNLLIIGFLSSLIILPWFIYVYNVTGSFIPSSGAAQSEFATIQTLHPRIVAMFMAIIENFTPWIYTGAKNLVVLGALLSLVVFIFLFRKTIFNNFNYIKTITLKNILYTWVISVLVLICIYTFFFWASHFYYRYSSPISIFVIVFMGIVISNYFETKNNILIKSFTLIVIVLFFIQSYISFHSGVIGNSHSVSAGFIKKHFSLVRKVGVFQSGVIGYFNNNVINLDGKIDNNALISIKNKKLDDYIEEQGIEVLVDWPSYIFYNLDSNYLKKNWVEYPIRIKNNASICLIKKNKFDSK